MFTVGDAAYRHYRTTADHQRQSRHPTTAVLAHDTRRHPEPGSAEAEETRHPVTVRFTDPHGRTRTARTDALPGLTSGSTVDVWLDEKDGTITEPPMTADQIRSRTMGWAIIAFLAVALTGAAVHVCAARLSHRRDLADWETLWAETAPRRTTSR
ncbi:Rv1733c family protein [Streptomyces sp. NBC_00582]|uniref:Rv1733c family protein n=1 Tax=Streptomyces sp. NBC_00582 TaxID=2975783 RepID=UPI003FCDD8C1